MIFAVDLPGARSVKQGQPYLEQSPLFQAGESGYFSHRIPAMVVTPGGTVLAFAEARRVTGDDDDEIHLVQKRSLDGGVTWQPLQVLFADGERSVGQPTPIVDAVAGTVVLVFCKDNKQVFVTQSADDGMTWSSPSEITEQVVDPTWAYLGAGPGHGIQLASGRLLVPSWGDVTHGNLHQRPNPQQFSYAMFSDDHGATWRRSEPMDLDVSDECMAVQTADGSVYMDMRSRPHKFCRAYAWSRDDGATWSGVAHHEHLPEPFCQGSIIRYSLETDGDRNRVIMAHPAETSKRGKLTVYMSDDECRTWPVARVLCPGFSGYSDLAVTPDKTILCLYESNKDKWANSCQSLTLARFNLAWLAHGEDGVS